jgi:hypothetical protein
MNSIVGICATLCWATVVVVATIAAPWALSDRNTFLAGFVNHEFLAFMGVIVTITLASAANIHLELNRYEESFHNVSFTDTKRHVRHSAYALIGALVASLVVVVVKPLGPATEAWQSGVNGMALTVILAGVMILIDLTQAAFGLEPLRRPRT